MVTVKSSSPVLILNLSGQLHHLIDEQILDFNMSNSLVSYGVIRKKMTLQLPMGSWEVKDEKREHKRQIWILKK